MAKVKVFVDYPNFEISLERRRLGEAERRQLMLSLADVIEPRLGQFGHAPELRSVTFYASCDEHAPPRGPELAWLKGELDRQQRYTVNVLRRRETVRFCPSGHEIAGQRERGVDTKIVCDLVTLAMRNIFDIGIVVSNDGDLIPAIEMVQQRLDKQIVHLGFQDEDPAIRAACWAHMKLSPDDLYRKPADTGELTREAETDG